MRRRPPRMFPDAPLGPMKKRYEDTFSAETVLMEAFFPDLVRKKREAESQDAKTEAAK